MTSLRCGAPWRDIRAPGRYESLICTPPGFTLQNPDRLEGAMLELAQTAESSEDGQNECGVFRRTEGILIGPTAELPVVLVWLQRFTDGSFHFVTLKPKKHE